MISLVLKRAASSFRLTTFNTPVTPFKPHPVSSFRKDFSLLSYISKMSSAAPSEPTDSLKREATSEDKSQNGSRPNGNGKKQKPKSKRFKDLPPADTTSPEGVLNTDIKTLLKSKDIPEEAYTNDLRAYFARPRDFKHPEYRQVSVEILGHSGGGEGIGIVKADSEPNVNEENSEANDSERYQVVVVPFTVPGDVVEAKLYRTQKYYFNADLISVTKASPKRDDSLVRCKYFGKCQGCQYQMLSYEDQLSIKQNVITNAYKHNSNLDPSLIPAVGETVGSPEQYNYRTKLTPHFEMPRKKPEVAPPVGFGQPGRKAVIDIEECAIATPVINQGLTRQRAWFKENFKQYKRGATLLLRETTVEEPVESLAEVQIEESSEKPTNKVKICSTSTKDIITEYVGKYVFKYPSSSFFQNNNSILESVTGYVRDNVVLPGSGLPPNYLVDAYCGCGLFSITCAGSAKSIIGVEISQDSVNYATKNAALNGVDASFVVGTASKIFDNVKAVPEETAIIIDPPRKGCDHPFLDQLLDFKPAKIVYVSCNVHSQARDIGYLLNSEKGKGYHIDSIRGFDFFPQTHHVESVAVLSWKQ